MNYRSNTYALFILLLLNTSALAQTINRAEYFIDNDPGHGNGTAVAVTTPAATVNFNFTINTNSLSTGFHILGFRLRQNNGRWGQPNHSLFYITPVTPAATNLTKAEYFFDTDPGLGNGTPFTFTAGSTVSIPALNVNIGALAPGFHFINFRFRDDRGRWTHTSANSFYVIPLITTDLATNITRIEYFFDTDLGAGNNTFIPIAAGNPQSNTFPITLPPTLTPGFHQIGFRYRDNKNRWSQAEARTFYVLPPIASNNRQIVAAEYYVDSPQGTGTSKPISGIVPGATLDQLVALDMTGVPTGNHTLSVRIKDSKGFWSYLVTENFTVSACTPPTPPVAPGVSRCNAGAVTLAATGASGAQVYRWYDDPILNNLLFTGSSFTTPSLSASKNYYVSIFDSGTNCESARVTVAATVTTIAKPIINPSGSLSICEGSSIFLSAPAGFSTYVWSNGQTTQQILATASGNYAVQTGNGTCLSETSDAVTVSVIPSPTKPVITASGNTTICGTGSVTLSGPVGFEYQWSTGATTQTITVNQTGVFFLIVKTTGANCPSFPSDPVVVSVLTPPCGVGSTNQPPIINNKPFAAQIEGRVELDLTNVVSDPDNNLDFSTLRVINNQTARGVAASIDASYFLQINYAGNPFTGVDRITLGVCDLAGLCVQQVIDIDVVGEVIVFNGITPDGDGLNDFMEIKYVDVVEGASKNKVTVFNRWGDAVWEVEDYDNLTRVFSGQTNSGKDLPSGTYFYKIDFPQGKPKTGFITLKR
jgi:gliding motility-associated-like protein